MQWTLVASDLAQGAVELELQDRRQEVAGVGDVGRDVILGARVEVILRTLHRRDDPLVLGAQRPPGGVVVLGLDLAGEDIPAPLVDQQAEGQEGDLVQGTLHQRVERVLGHVAQQPQLDQVGRRHREGDGVTQGLVEAVVGAVAEESREVTVVVLVVVVAQLVVNGCEVLGVDLDAHLDPQVVDVVHVPGAGVADRLPIPRLAEHGALPKGLGQLGQAQGDEEALSIAHHLPLVGLLGLERLAQVEAACAAGRDEVVDVVPGLAPHVAQQVGRDGRPILYPGLTVLLLQLCADVAVQVLVERLDLVPEAVGLGLESRR